MRDLSHAQMHELLEVNYEKYNSTSFIDNDPIRIPHLFSSLQDIEIAGFFAATLAWGQRKTIINKCMELMQMFDFAPYDFILNHMEADLKSMENFKHRTFNYTDLLYFIHFFKDYYQQHFSLESLFVPVEKDAINTKSGIINFHNRFVSLEYFPLRTGKHVASPAKKSSCKRINMFLRWMVRKDKTGVDFGIWKKIKPSQLICPCDVHVVRIGTRLKLISGKVINWDMAEELTLNLKKFDVEDPVKYDFALFGMGIDKIF